MKKYNKDIIIGTIFYTIIVASSGFSMNSYLTSGKYFYVGLNVFIIVMWMLTFILNTKYYSKSK